MKQWWKFPLLGFLPALLLSSAVMAYEWDELPPDSVQVEVQEPDLDADTQLMYYLEQEAGVLPEASLMAEAGDRLTGLEKAIYEAIKPIVKEIAAGRRQSTEIMLNLNALGYSGASVSRESFHNIWYCLYADCPYDFYWYANSSTWGTIGSLFYWRFHVSQYYAAGEFQVRSDLGSLLTKVQANAQAVVAFNILNSGKSDYEKLEAYKDKICELVDYDYAAAASGNILYDSNPYQLMYVFDGDPSTKVVCEGYAKAFQFLCDLSVTSSGASVFKASDFACYHVKGMAVGPSGGNPDRHSWNHVTLNGKTYMVDVTFCDTGVPYDFMAHALPGKNTRATGYEIPDPSDFSRTAKYTDIDFYQYSRDKNQSNENLYDKDAPFLTLTTVPYGSYQVTVVGGTGSGYYQPGDTVRVSSNPAPSGYSLGGYWSKPAGIPFNFEEDSGNQTMTFSMPEQTVTVYAALRYIVTFDPNGGTVSPNRRYLYISTDTPKTYATSYMFEGDLPAPTYHGYAFDGWYTEKEGGIKITSSTRPVSFGNHTIYAHWTPDQKTYKVTIIDGTGSGDYREGEPVTISANPAPAGCKIWGWRGPTQLPLTFVKDSPVQQASFTMPGYAVTFRALYAFTVTFDPNGGTMSETDTSRDLRFTTDRTYVHTYGQSGDLPTPAREGYTFDGWYTAKTDGVKVDSDTVPSTLASHTLYARWTPVLNYSLSFSPDSVTVREGERQTVVVTCTNRDFRYINHNISSDNKTISAVWDSDSKTTNSISLSIQGLSAGKETVRISLLDSERNVLYADSFDVTVTPRASSDTKIVIEGQTAFRGATVALPVAIQRNPGIAGATLAVSYDKSALTLNNIIKGALFKNGSYSADPSSGIVQWYHTENITEDGILFTLQFTVNDHAQDGNYVVSAGVRDGIAANLSNADSNIVDAQFVSGTLKIEPGVRGDVTGDRIVAINDVVKVARSVAGNLTLTAQERTLADVTGDSIVAINDVVKLARYVAGNIASLQSADTALLLASDSESAVIEVAAVSGRPGETIRVPVSITNNSGIAGAQLDVLFDNRLTLKNIIQGDVLSAGVFYADVSNGRIQWYYDQANIMDTGILFTLEFEAGADAKNGDTYAVTVNVKDEIAVNLSDYDSNPVNIVFRPGKVQIGGIAGNAVINKVQCSGNTVTANIVCADSSASLFCGVYDASGKMIAVRSAQITGESNYQFRFDGQEFAYAKVFLVDGDFLPLCESRVCP